ncbi:MAG: M56 family metallopeptidase, partial [Oscillospiraceae bacterium]|nr:M56 family metallopeptidase [Oscillospiraceae bacterium]
MIEWIVSSWVLILVVILLRQLAGGRISSRLRYALWLPVLLRLLIPVSFGNIKFSAEEIVPNEVANRVETTITQPLGYVGYELPDLAPPEPDPTLSEAEQKLQYEENLADWEREMELAKAVSGKNITAKSVLLFIWIAGAAVAGLCLIISNLRFGARLRRSSVLLTEDAPREVYVSNIVETPCLFGLFQPAIYLTPGVAEDENALRHVIAHEAAHARHGDHIWAVLRGACLAIRWYDPLVWLAAALSRQDAELACDEGALKTLGESERSSYGSTLIALATGHSSLMLTATTMSGGKRNLKERVKLIAQKPKTAAIAVVLVLIVAAAAVVCTFSGSEEGDELKTQLRKVEWTKEFTEMGGEKTQAMYDKIYECFYIYKAARPEDNVDISSIGVTRGEGGNYIIEVQCYGSDMAEFERIADLPDYVRLVYEPNELDQSENHPIPREPDSRKSYTNGPALMTMDKSVYPLYPETISFTWSAGAQDVSYGAGYALHKYVNDEWRAVPQNPNVISILYVLQAGKTERREFVPPRLGEGLYRITVGMYSVEFAVSAEVE